jgi:hypothetical protein
VGESAGVADRMSFDGFASAVSRITEQKGLPEAAVHRMISWAQAPSSEPRSGSKSRPNTAQGERGSEPLKQDSPDKQQRPQTATSRSKSCVELSAAEHDCGLIHGSQTDGKEAAVTRKPGLYASMPIAPRPFGARFNAEGAVTQSQSSSTSDPADKASGKCTYSGGSTAVDDQFNLPKRKIWSSMPLMAVPSLGAGRHEAIWGGETTTPALQDKGVRPSYSSPALQDLMARLNKPQKPVFSSMPLIPLAQ